MVRQRAARWYRYLTAAIVASLGVGTPLQATAAALQAGQPVANQQVVISGGVVTVGFDLSASEPDAVFAVVLEVSEDGGRTYKPASTVTGDVGANVKAGASKQIKWDAQKDVETLQLGDIRYRVTAQRPQSEITAPRPASQLTRPANITEAPSLAPPPATSHGNKMKWPGLAAMGLGAALAGTAFGPLKATKMVTHTIDWTRYYLPGQDASCVNSPDSTNFSGYPVGTCEIPTKVNNTMVIGGGLAIVGAGAALFILGGRTHTNPEIEFIPGGIVLHRHVTW